MPFDLPPAPKFDCPQGCGWHGSHLDYMGHQRWCERQNVTSPEPHNDRYPVDPWRPTRDERDAIWHRINAGTASRNDCMGLVYMADHLDDEVTALRTTIQAFQRDKERWLREQMKADREIATLRAKLEWYEGAVPSVAAMQAMRAERDEERELTDYEREERLRAEAEVERMRAERDELQHDWTKDQAEWRTEVQAWRDEVERMRPVVAKLEAALRQYANFQRGAFRDGAPDYVRDALAAVDAYRATSEQETTNG